MENYIIDMLGRKIPLTGRVPYKAKPSVPIPAAYLGKRSDTVIFWLGGGGFLVNSRGVILLFDPVMGMDKSTMTSETGHKMIMHYPLSADALPKVDMIFYTHPDLDHVGPETSRIFALRHIPRTAPKRVADLLFTHGVLKEEVSVCRAGDSFTVAGCVVEAIPADHPWQLINPKLHGKPLGKDDVCGFVIRTPDGSILLPGDTRLLETHFNIPDVNVVLIDTAKCVFHLNVEGAILLSNAYKNAYLIPYHYGMFDEPTIPAQENGDPSDVLCVVENADERAFMLAPGEPFILCNKKHLEGDKKS